MCKKTLHDGKIVCVEKCIDNLIALCKAGKDGKHVIPRRIATATFHKVCRSENIKERNISRFLDENTLISKDEVYSNHSIDFIFETNCFLCSNTCNIAVEQKKNA